MPVPFFKGICRVRTNYNNNIRENCTLLRKSANIIVQNTIN